jgi:hypothetical protein
MDKKLFIQKIEQLSNDKLKELLQLRNKANSEILILAETEAKKRGIDPDAIEASETTSKPLKTKPEKEEDVNWLGVLASLLSELH